MVGSRQPLSSWATLLMGRRGAVVTHHPLATQVGMDVLTSGGTAFDAAVAVGATIAVVEPHGSGVGGDGLYLLWQADKRRITVVQALGRAPVAATPGLYEKGIPPTGALASTVPAAAAGWALMAERYAAQPRASLFEAAIHYAREGFPVTEALCRQIHARREVLRRDPACAATFLAGGKAPHAGASIKNPALARTLEELGDRGWDPSAESLKSLVAFSQRNGGVLGAEDLSEVRVEEKRPLESTYRGIRVLSAPPPSMGFALLLKLNILEGFDVAAARHLSADGIHLMVEAKKQAYLQRERYGGDPDFIDVPLERLLSKELGRDLSFRLDPRRPTPAGTPAAKRGDTTHFCIVDSTGNAVSAIQSLAEAFGACTMDPETGVLLNNRMVWFHLDPEHPNHLAPGRHARHTMNTPMAFAGNELRYVFGAPGGDGEVQAAAQVFSAMVDHGFDPQKAAEAPRWSHFQPGTSSRFPHENPDVLLLESRIKGHIVDELRRRGHSVATIGPYEDACSANIVYKDSGGMLVCGADPRRDGRAGAF